jgi:hypothetical protein
MYFSHRGAKERGINTRPSTMSPRIVFSFLAGGPDISVPPCLLALLKLEEKQQKRTQILFTTAYSITKTGKPFTDFQLMCEIQASNGLDIG